jgi:hypothetical protein
VPWGDDGLASVKVTGICWKGDDHDRNHLYCWVSIRVRAWMLAAQIFRQITKLRFVVSNYREPCSISEESVNSISELASMVFRLNYDYHLPLNCVGYRFKRSRLFPVEYVVRAKAPYGRNPQLDSTP